MCGKKVLDTKNYKQTSVWLEQTDISNLFRGVEELCRKTARHIQIKLEAYHFVVVFMFLFNTMVQ